MGRITNGQPIQSKKSAAQASKRNAKPARARAPRKRLEALPVTLLSGFLGSGKTSLLTHVLNNRQGLRVAVIVNEISEINIDALALEGAHILQSDEKVVEMSNGCICCTLREDLLKTLRDLHAQQLFDAVLIESSGIAEPMQVAETFFVDIGDGNGVLQSKAPLQNCVTVVDASTLKNFLHDPRAATAIDPKAKDEKENQSVGELLIQQIEFANVVILNKLDLLMGEAVLRETTDEGQDAKLGEIKALIRSINPTADIFPAVRGIIPTHELFSVQRFTESWANSVIGWMEDIASGVKHTPETLEYGIGSFLYTADRPFHPQRLHDWVDKNYYWLEIVEQVVEEELPEEAEGDDDHAAEGGAKDVEEAPTHEQGSAKVAATNGGATSVEGNEAVELFGAEEKRIRDAAYGVFFRSKGFVWLGNPARLGHVMEWSQAGTVLSLEYATTWEYFATQVRGQRLVFIGQEIRKDALKRDLDSLLLTEEEWAAMQRGEYDAAPLPDPFRPFPPVDDEASIAE